jgi:hypothetical protein
MDKLYIFAVAIGVLVLLGMIYSIMNYHPATTTTTTKEIVVTRPVYVAPRYGYGPPPPPPPVVYRNPYEARYY